jgi:hypothetical protein
MKRRAFLRATAAAFMLLTPGACFTQGAAQTKTVVIAKPPSELIPREDHATEAQIREYLQLSGQMADFQQRWIAAVDLNRSIGAPYWPESFWTDLKAQMKKTDLTPMFVTLFQHYASQGTMQEIIDAYHSLGKENFQGTPMCFKVGEINLAMEADANRLTLAKTQEVTLAIYEIYKPRIKAARAKYLAEHPDWKDEYAK